MRIEVLGQPDQSYEATLVQRSGRIVMFQVPREIPVNALVRADVQGKALLGEVVYCRSEYDSFEILLKARHSAPLTRHETCPWLG
jgi:hypothetical protein